MFGFLHEALDYYRSSVELLDTMRALLQSEDSWKITFRDLHQDAYTTLWRTLLNLENTYEALCAAEQGRAQALRDALKILYGVTVPLSDLLEANETISFLSRNSTTQIAFLVPQQTAINIWIPGRENEVVSRKGEIEGGSEIEDCVTSFLDNALGKIGAGVSVSCENRSLDCPRGVTPIDEEAKKQIVVASHCTVDSLRALDDVIIGPIKDLIQGDELIIVPDGPLCLAPWAALTDSIWIRAASSLTSLRLITDCAGNHHSKSGALPVGGPCVQDVPISLTQLP